MKNRYLLVLAAGLLAVLSSSAQEVVRLENEKITFTLPDGWSPIPQTVLEQENALLKKHSLEASPFLADFKYGYQIPGSQWFSYPYLLIRTVTDKIPESTLRKVPTVDMKGTENGAKKLFPDTLSAVRIGDDVYDPETKKIWTQTKTKMADGDEYCGLTMMQATEIGLTVFMFYSSALQYEELRPVFMKIATSVTPDPEVIYRSNDPIAVDPNAVKSVRR